MNEDFNMIFEKWKNKDLITWIKDYEQKFYKDMEDSNNEKKEFFEKIYNGTKNIRNYFYNNYLTDMSDNLNNKSDENNYQYINFFRQIPPKQRKLKYKFNKKEEIEYYDDKEDNEDNNYYYRKEQQEEYNTKYNRAKYEDTRNESNRMSKNIENDYFEKKN